MVRKVRLIFTGCQQVGQDHWAQVFETVDIEIEVPDKILGRDAKAADFVGLEFLESED